MITNYIVFTNVNANAQMQMQFHFINDAILLVKNSKF